MKKATHLNKEHTLKYKLFLATLSILFYLIVLFFFLPEGGAGVTAFVIIPVIVISWFSYNMVIGFIIGVIGSFFTNSIIFSLYYHEPILKALINHKGIAGSTVVTFAGGIIGYLSNLQKKYKTELSVKKKIQIELEKSKNRIEHILRTIPSAVFIVDKEKRITLWNTTAELITGLKEKDVLGKTCLEIWYCKECKNNCGILDREIKKTVFGKELEILLKDGRKITIVKNVDVLLDENGEFDGGVESFIDITDRKKMENEISEIAEGFKTIFNESKEGLILIDPEDGTYIEVNPVICEIFGYKKEELIGKPHTILFDNIDFPNKIELMNKIQKGYSINNIEIKVKLKNGETGYFIIGATPIFWRGKKVFFGYLQDVTHLKTLQIELERKNREIVNLTNTITHDLRNPLTGIRGVFELTILDNKKLDEYDKNLFQMALKEVEYMQNLLDDLIDAARTDEDKKEFTKEEIPAKKLIEEVLDILNIQIKRKNIETLVNTDDTKIFVDVNQFKKVLMNIIGNAINYIGQKEKPLIVIEAKQQGDMAELSVKDNGIGIPEDAIPLIFERFKRGPNVENIKGNGLGLFIVKNIVEKHGGKIFVYSKLNEGSTFIVRLPLKQK